MGVFRDNAIALSLPLNTIALDDSGLEKAALGGSLVSVGHCFGCPQLSVGDGQL